MPSAQLSQAVCPGLVWYWPAAQFEQAVPRPASLAYVPAAQSEQLVSSSAPTVVEYLPSGQLMQSDAAVFPVAAE